VSHQVQTVDPLSLPDVHPNSTRRVGRGSALVAGLRSREGTLLLVIVAACAGLTLLRPQFLTTANLRAVATGTIYDLPLAGGMTIVLVTGGIDLSVGALLALTGVCITLLLGSGVPVGVAVAAGFGLAAAVGFLNGVLAARFGLPPFIVTLGTMSIARGTAAVLTSGYMISGLPDSYIAFGRARWLGIPVPLVVTVLLLATLDLLVRRWRPLHDAFYVGQNAAAARLSGINVARVTISAYVLSGVLAAVSAAFMTARLGMGYARFGDLAELRAIAAAVLGGASFSGGSGSVAGSALGVLLLAVILNGFVLLDFSIYWQSVASGVILIVAIAVDHLRGSAS
jgi:ribose/xylose/arabinose/galactoside ABC-type transport system permease subunit